MCGRAGLCRRSCYNAGCTSKGAAMAVRRIARPSRRGFLCSTAATGGLMWAGGGLAFLSKLRPVSADEAKLPASLVRLDNGIEPTVRMLEETAREKLLEEVAARIKGGLGYRELLAALQLAGVRNVQP